MPEDKCAKCGATLPEGALVCHDCKTLTPTGREARGLGAQSEDEAWAQSVQAAKERHAHRPPVDPDAVLRQVVAQTGTDDQLQRLTRDDIALDDRRTEYAAFRAVGKGLLSVGTMLAVLLAAAGLLRLVVVIVQANNSVSAVPEGMGVAVYMGALAMAAYFLFRFLADAVTIVADIADNSHRTVLLLRRLAARPGKDEQAPDG
jgi:hypothetical protein